jgi:hypothetical protein
MRLHGPGRRHLTWSLVLYLDLAATGRATTPAQRHSGLGENPVDEAVRPSCRGRQRADALSGVVPLTEERRQLAPIHAGHPGAFLKRLGHLHLLLAGVTSEFHISLGNDQAWPTD